MQKIKCHFTHFLFHFFFYSCLIFELRKKKKKKLQIIGAFSRFLPSLPYPFVSDDNSPPISAHSPPAGIAMTNLPVTPTVLRPQPQLPATAVSIAATTAINHLNNACSPSNLSPLRIRVSSPNRINSDLTSIVHQQHGLTNPSVISNQQQQRTNGIVRIASGGNINSMAGLLTSSLNSICSVPPPTLHRPFSPSPQPKDVS